jgi:hypothetical protein
MPTDGAYLSLKGVTASGACFLALFFWLPERTGAAIMAAPVTVAFFMKSLLELFINDAF